MTDQAPLTTTREATIPAAAATADVDQAVTESPVDGTVTKVALVPEAAATGDNTNNRTFTLINKGQAGTGTTVIATLALTAGVNLAAFVEKAFTLSGVAGATTVAQGDALVVAETHGGTGLAHSGARVLVTFSRA